MVVDQEEGEDQNDLETEMQDRVKRHEVKLQILVDSIQDIKDRMDCMFKRREMNPLKEDGQARISKKIGTKEKGTKKPSQR